jgi:hypothetical protein
MSRLISTGVVVAALLAVMTPAPAGAITNDKLTYLTLSGPVQVPGTTLNAGTYRFRLTNAETSRNTLQILSNDGSVLYAMFNTIPDRRASITDEAILSFRETPAGVPAAARSLFYGGEEIGYEFVYPKGGPNMIPEVVPQSEITYLTVPASAPEPIAEPEPELVPEPVVEPEPVPEQAAPPAELPRTATPLPLVAVGGFITLLAGLGIGLARRLVA